MARVRLSAGRSAERPARTRGAMLDRALVAAGEPSLLTTYDMTRGTAVERFFYYWALEDGLEEMSHGSWPSEQGSLLDAGVEPLFRDGQHEAVYRLEDGTLVCVGLGDGWARVKVASARAAEATGALSAFRTLYPATYLDAVQGEKIPVTFWMNGTFGPSRRLRLLDAAPWADVQRNYPPSIHDALDATMTRFEPGKGGQLLLWQGPPGTGKTYALRALVSEWLEWAEFHYITDPDAFFVEQPSYMVDVLLADSYAAIDETGDVYAEADPLGKWRVLILEDTGELLSATAKEKYGQGLSRLLNVVDGMIGQGLRILVLVTTNDELGELNAAAQRPGRCASRIVFPEFTAEEASEWLGESVEEGGTVAELYARQGGALVAAVLNDPVEEIRRVAAAHADDAVGYGETAWNPETRTVLWVHGDWTDCDPARDDWMAIDGVDAVSCEAEGLPDGWWDADVVYPNDPPQWVTERPEQAEAALADAVALAAQPFNVT